MCHWLTGEWVHCQLAHMELQSQSNSTDTEIVQEEQEQSAPVLRGTHSEEIHKNKCFQEDYESKFVVSKVLDVIQVSMP